MPWRCFNHAVCGSSRPRASPNSVRCTGNACKDALKATRQQQGGAASTEGLVVAAAQAAAEEMPHGVSVHEVEEILGERCCKPTEMSKKKRKNGPGKELRQQFLVRGTFLQPADDDEDDEDDDYAGARHVLGRQGRLAGDNPRPGRQRCARGTP